MKDALIHNVKPDIFNQDPTEVRSARISALHREKPVVVKDYVGEAKSLREHILRLSLFPNVANAKTIRMSG